MVITTRETVFLLCLDAKCKVLCCKEIGEGSVNAASISVRKVVETALAAMYTHLVKTGIISLEKLTELLVDNPRKRFGLPLGLDFSVWDLSREYTVDPGEFQSMGKASPFTGMNFFGRCILTVCDGKIVWQE